MPQGTMTAPLKRQKPKEPEDPNSVLNVFKRGFMTMEDRAKAQVEADRQAKEIKRKKDNGEYDDSDN